MVKEWAWDNNKEQGGHGDREPMEATKTTKRLCQNEECDTTGVGIGLDLLCHMVFGFG